MEGCHGTLHLEQCVHPFLPLHSPLTSLLGVTFWASYVFFNAIFPKLSHDLPEVRHARELLLNGSISEEEFEHRCSMARSKIMNISYVWNNVGFTVCGALSLAALAGIGANDSTAQNNWGYSVSVAVCTGFWIVLAIPWFLWEKKRPGPSLPAGDNYLTFGLRHTWWTAKQAWTLKQTLFYLVAFFLLADGIVRITRFLKIDVLVAGTPPIPSHAALTYPKRAVKWRVLTSPVI
jgi:MFS-type transporter involved in bile tolerance (Atg22 family)